MSFQQKQNTTNDSYEHQRWLKQNIRNAERAHDKRDEFLLKTNEAAINAGNLALRMALIINGGAAVALLSRHLPPEQMKTVANALLWFAWGVVTSVAGMGLAYFTNYCTARMAYSQTNTYNHPFVSDERSTWFWNLVVIIFHVAAVIAFLSSLALFIAGMLSVRAAFI